MDAKPRWIVWVGITLGVILVLVIGGFAGVMVYRQIKPERETSHLTQNQNPATTIHGATVVEVVADGPAELAGIAVGDTLLQIDGREITADNSLTDLIAAYQPGDEIQITLRHAGSSEEVALAVTLGDNPDQPVSAYLGVSYRSQAPAPIGWTAPSGREQVPDNPRRVNPRGNTPGENTPWGNTPDGNPPGTLENPNQFWNPRLFLESCSDLPDDLQGTEGVCGLIIAQVAEGSPAQESELQAGDLITALNGTQLTTRQALLDAIQSDQPGDKITLTVYRVADDTELEIALTLGENPQQAGQAYIGVTLPGFFFSSDGSTWPPFGGIPRFNEEPELDSGAPSLNNG